MSLPATICDDNCLNIPITLKSLNALLSLVHGGYPVSMRIRPEETDLAGRWETVGGAVCANVAAKRIAELTRTYPCEVGGWPLAQGATD
jgi:hypothetical protein